MTPNLLHLLLNIQRGDLTDYTARTFELAACKTKIVTGTIMLVHLIHIMKLIPDNPVEPNTK